MTKSLTKVRFECPVHIDDLCVDSDGSVDDMEDVEHKEGQLSGTIFSH